MDPNNSVIKRLWCTCIFNIGIFFQKSINGIPCKQSLLKWIFWLQYCFYKSEKKVQRPLEQFLRAKLCFNTQIPLFNMVHSAQLGIEHGLTLQKHAYSNIYKISSPKSEKIQIKNSDIFHISAQNTDCGYSLELPRRSMFLSRNKKNNV